MTPLDTYESLARLIDHPLVKPELTDEQVIEGLERRGLRIPPRVAEYRHQAL